MHGDLLEKGTKAVEAVKALIAAGGDARQDTAAHTTIRDMAQFIHALCTEIARQRTEVQTLQQDNARLQAEVDRLSAGLAENDNESDSHT